MEKEINLTEREALLCERAFEMVGSAMWTEFQDDINTFSGQKLTDDELETLNKKLRGE